MEHIQQFLLSHSYAVLFLFVLAEQVGLPLPSSPFLLAAGALAGLHRMNLAAVLGIAVLASLLSDSLWFLVGKFRGNSALNFLCKVSLDPESCVATTRSIFSRYGPALLLVSKFVPEFGTLGPPLAGMVGVVPWKFLLLDLTGALIWSGTFTGLGWLLRDQLEDAAKALARFGGSMAAACVIALVAFVAVKYVQRRRAYSFLRMARLSPVELKRRLDAGEQLTIVDLRPPREWSGGKIPGAVQLTKNRLDRLLSESRPKELILYCSRPQEAECVRAAIRLELRGIRQAHPLEGGFAMWRQLGFPIEPSALPEGSDSESLLSAPE